MSDAYMSQVQPYSFNFPPRGWALCAGNLLAIAQNTALFSLLGTTYGGNGINTFQLPNLQSCVPMHVGNGYSLGEVGGVEQVTLNLSNLPMHTHTFNGTSTLADENKPQANGLALAQISNKGSPGGSCYGPASPLTPLNPTSLGVAGSNLPHSNIQPYLAINWCICMQGIFPSRN